MKVLLYGLTGDSGFGYITRGIRNAYSRRTEIMQIYSARKKIVENIFSR